MRRWNRREVVRIDEDDNGSENTENILPKRSLRERLVVAIREKFFDNTERYLSGFSNSELISILEKSSENASISAWKVLESRLESLSTDDVCRLACACGLSQKGIPLIIGKLLEKQKAMDIQFYRWADLLVSPHDTICAFANDAINSLHPSEAKACFRRITVNKNVDLDIRIRLIRKLTSYEDRRELMQIVSDQSEYYSVRMEAIYQLLDRISFFQSCRMFENLVHNERNNTIRGIACLALRTEEKNIDTFDLIAIAGYTRNRNIRYAALSVLKDRKEVFLPDFLMETAGDTKEDILIRIGAVEALENKMDEKTASFLLRLMDDECRDMIIVSEVVLDGYNDLLDEEELVEMALEGKHKGARLFAVREIIRRCDLLGDNKIGVLKEILLYSTDEIIKKEISDFLDKCDFELDSVYTQYMLSLSNADGRNVYRRTPIAEHIWQEALRFRREATSLIGENGSLEEIDFFIQGFLDEKKTEE